jgi:hypothetical protein
MVSLSEIINLTPVLAEIFKKIILFAIALFFGRLVIAGWRAKKDFLIMAVGTFLLGALCYALGIILPLELFPVAFVSLIINTAIVAGIFALILFLFSPREKHAEAGKKPKIPIAPEKIIGVVVTAVFVIFIFTLMTPENIGRMADAFSLGKGITVGPSSCANVTAATVITAWVSDKELRVNVTVPDAVEKNIQKYLNSSDFVSQFLYSKPIFVNLNKTNYGLFFITKTKIDSLPVSLLTMQQSMTGGENQICAVNLNKSEVCSCSSPAENSESIMALLSSLSK